MSEPYSRIEHIQTQPVDWTSIPTKSEVEQYYLSATYQDSISRESYYYPAFEIKPDQYLNHQTKSVDDIIKLYESNGFETRNMVDDPFGHPGPTVACPIGFPFSLKKEYPELRRYNRWICRVHVDIFKIEDENIVSLPHIEPDPIFHSIPHFSDKTIRGNIVRGPVAIEILNSFLHLKQ